jgi:Fic family protein
LQLKKIATKIDSLLANFVTISHNKFSDSIVKNLFGSIARFKLDDGSYFGLFLEGIRQTAQNSIETFRAIIALRQEIEYQAILTLGKKTKLAQNFLHFLYSKPITDSQETAKQLSVNPSTVLRLMDDFVRLGILKEITGYKRNRVFVFEKYLKLFE